MNKITEQKLEKVGLTKVAKKIKELKDLKLKTIIAYEHYRFVRPENFEKFNEKLKDQTLRESGLAGRNLYHNYDKLRFTKIEDYEKIPPEHVLTSIEEAIDKKCFDSFEVCDLESVKEYKDPIIFGCIKLCKDKFFIAQWDDDVKIEDILETNEG